MSGGVIIGGCLCHCAPHCLPLVLGLVAPRGSFPGRRGGERMEGMELLVFIQSGVFSRGVGGSHSLVGLPSPHYRPRRRISTHPRRR